MRPDAPAEPWLSFLNDLHGLIDLIIGLVAFDAAVEQAREGHARDGRLVADDETGELADNIDDAGDGVVEMLRVFLHLLGLVVVRLDEIDVADDNAEEIIQVMRDALGDGADGSRATGVAEAALEIDEFAVDGDETQLRLDAGESFVEVDGLRDVIDCADAEAFEFSFLRCAGGDENNGNGARLVVGLEMLADFDAVHVGHHHIQQNKVGLFGGDEIQRIMTAVGCEDGHAFAFEFALEQLDVDWLVVDDENFGSTHTVWGK